MEVNASRSARARVRAELAQEILDAARAHLAVEGPAGLSLRAVARDLRRKYSDLPIGAFDELEQAFDEILERHGYAPEGPRPGEDEIPDDEVFD